tara:strand:+ start:3557 stop:3994 length:438 start_codon:yes stop_codon:yes gene_type:complete
VKRIAVLLLAFVLFSCDSVNTKRVISTDNAPQAIGPYSQAIQVNNTLYLAGQIALDPITGQMVEDKIEVQTHRVMKNLGAVLSEAGFSFDDVVQSQVFLSDLNHYKPMNKIYAEYFNSEPPARAVVQTALPRDALVEIMMVAQKP